MPDMIRPKRLDVIEAAPSFYLHPILIAQGLSQQVEIAKYVFLKAGKPLYFLAYPQSYALEGPRHLDYINGMAAALRALFPVAMCSDQITVIVPQYDNGLNFGIPYLPARYANGTIANTYAGGALLWAELKENGCPVR